MQIPSQFTPLENVPDIFRCKNCCAVLTSPDDTRTYVRTDRPGGNVCLHRVCAGCAAKFPDRCPVRMCGIRGIASEQDHKFGSIVKLYHATRLFQCKRCSVMVSGRNLAVHQSSTCAKIMRRKSGTAAGPPNQRAAAAASPAAAQPSYAAAASAISSPTSSLPTPTKPSSINDAAVVRAAAPPPGAPTLAPPSQAEQLRAFFQKCVASQAASVQELTRAEETTMAKLRIFEDDDDEDDEEDGVIKSNGGAAAAAAAAADEKKRLVCGRCKKDKPRECFLASGSSCALVAARRRCDLCLGRLGMALAPHEIDHPTRCDSCRRLFTVNSRRNFAHSDRTCNDCVEKRRIGERAVVLEAEEQRSRQATERTELFERTGMRGGYENGSRALLSRELERQLLQVQDAVFEQEFVPQLRDMCYRVAREELQLHCVIFCKLLLRKSATFLRSVKEEIEQAQQREFERIAQAQMQQQRKESELRNQRAAEQQQLAALEAKARKVAREEESLAIRDLFNLAAARRKQTEVRRLRMLEEVERLCEWEEVPARGELVKQEQALRAETEARRGQFEEVRERERSARLALQRGATQLAKEHDAFGDKLLHDCEREAAAAKSAGRRLCFGEKLALDIPVSEILRLPFVTSAEGAIQVLHIVEFHRRRAIARAWRTACPSQAYRSVTGAAGEDDEEEEDNADFQFAAAGWGDDSTLDLFSCVDSDCVDDSERTLTMPLVRARDDGVSLLSRCLGDVSHVASGAEYYQALSILFTSSTEEDSDDKASSSDSSEPAAENAAAAAVVLARDVSNVISIYVSLFFCHSRMEFDDTFYGIFSKVESLQPAAVADFQNGLTSKTSQNIAALRAHQRLLAVLINRACCVTPANDDDDDEGDREYDPEAADPYDLCDAFRLLPLVWKLQNCAFWQQADYLDFFVCLDNIFLDRSFSYYQEATSFTFDYEHVEEYGASPERQMRDSFLEAMGSYTDLLALFCRFFKQLLSTFDATPRLVPDGGDSKAQSVSLVTWRLPQLALCCLLNLLYHDYGGHVEPSRAAVLRVGALSVVDELLRVIVDFVEKAPRVQEVVVDMLEGESGGVEFMYGNLHIWDQPRCAVILAVRVILNMRVAGAGRGVRLPDEVHQDFERFTRLLRPEWLPSPTEDLTPLLHLRGVRGGPLAVGSLTWPGQKPTFNHFFPLLCSCAHYTLLYLAVEVKAIPPEKALSELAFGCVSALNMEAEDKMFDEALSGAEASTAASAAAAANSASVAKKRLHDADVFNFLSVLSKIPSDRLCERDVHYWLQIVEPCAKLLPPEKCFHRGDDAGPLVARLSSLMVVCSKQVIRTEHLYPMFRTIGIWLADARHVLDISLMLAAVDVENYTLRLDMHNCLLPFFVRAAGSGHLVMAPNAGKLARKYAEVIQQLRATGRWGEAAAAAEKCAELANAYKKSSQSADLRTAAGLKQEEDLRGVPVLAAQSMIVDRPHEELVLRDMDKLLEMFKENTNKK